MDDSNTARYAPLMTRGPAALAVTKYPNPNTAFDVREPFTDIVIRLVDSVGNHVKAYPTVSDTIPEPFAGYFGYTPSHNPAWQFSAQPVSFFSVNDLANTSHAESAFLGPVRWNMNENASVTFGSKNSLAGYPGEYIITFSQTLPSCPAYDMPSSRTNMVAVKVTLAPCSGGHEFNADGLVCTVCPQGQYKHMADNTTCKMCPKGQYNTAPGEVDCMPCVGGIDWETQPLYGAVSCSFCTPGKYSTPSGCKHCPAGSYSQAGATSCINCTEGQSSNTGASQCEPCNRGSYSRHGLCELCPVGKYANDSGRTSCADCPRPSYSTKSGSFFCQRCSVGLYAPFGVDGFAGECLPCPVGVSCVNGDTLEQSGYYISVSASTGEITSAPCDGRRCMGGGKCAAGREAADVNPLCGKCLPDYR